MQRLWFLAAFFATAAFAEPRAEGPAPDDIENARFLQQPSGRDFVENYPPLATAQYVEGSATIECFVELDTSLRCRVTAETPMGWGFGQAALDISRSFRVAPATRNGVPTRGGRIRRTIRFVLPENASGLSAWDREFDALNPPLDLPTWDDAPNFYAMLDAYPASARRDQIQGRAILSCTVREDRRLNCTNHSERPTGQDFGAAALTLAAQFRVATTDADFIARHRREPFLLPILFGDDHELAPTDRSFRSLEPVRMPPLALGPPEPSRGAGPPPFYVSVMALCTVQNQPPLACVIEQESQAGYDLGAPILAMLATAPIDDFPVIPGDQMRFEFKIELP